MASIFESDGTRRKINPFYQEVDGFVKNELSNRASLVGRRVRSIGASRPLSVEWGYQKTAWAQVQSKYDPSIILGTAGTPTMSDSKGNLTLYNAERNVPEKPLLTGVEITNEGQLGSFMKSTFTFTIFPELNSRGFDIGGIEQAFFVPGREVRLKWGWSVYAQNQRACTGDFTGIVYNFSWNFNDDLSVTANVSIISPSGLALGISADMANPSDKTVRSTDASGRELIGSNLSTVIDSDLSQMTGSQALSYGQSNYIPKASTLNKKLDYIGIGLPIEESQQSTNNTPQSNRIATTQWFVKFGSVTQFINELLDSFDDPVKEIFAVQCFGNETQYLKDIVSAYPTEVYFPDQLMGKYGNLQPFGQGGPETNPLTHNTTEGLIDIGEILLGTNFVKSTYETFISDNANNVPYKSLPKFLDELCKKINHASGDTYELTPVLFEPKSNNINQSDDKAILTIEDLNLNTKIQVTPYEFSPTIFKPLIRNVNINSTPPPAMMMAAFTAARGGSKPDQSNIRLATKEQRDNKSFDKEYFDAKENIARLIFNGITQGFSNSWSEELRGFLVKIKRTSNTQDAHWLNKTIYPITFSLTIDGINGFKFGDTLSTTMIPSIYNVSPYKMLFTVTKITHKIENKDWTTTIETSARITSTGDGPELDGSENSGTDIRVGVSAPYKLQQTGVVVPSTPGIPTTAIPGLNPFNQPTITSPQRTSGAGTNLLPGESSSGVR